MSGIFFHGMDSVESLMVRLVGERSRATVRPESITALDLTENGQLFRASQANEIAPHVGHAIRDKGIDLPNAWQQVHDNSDRRIKLMMRELDEASQVLHAAGIPMVALKNAGIARGLHPCAACSPMGDLDVLVKPGDFKRAHEILVNAGFQFEFRSPLEEAEIDEAEASGGSEYWKPMENGEKLWFELQWRPIAGRWLRPDQEPTADELMDRSVSINETSSDLQPSTVRLLAPEDNLLQVAVHTAKHTYVRAPGFRLHTDVDRIVHTQPIDWDRFAKSVIERELSTAVYFSLWMPAILFDTPIPDDVLDALRPKAWKKAYLKRAIQKAGILYPERSKFGKAAYIAFNASLYDDLGGLARAIFPTSEWMVKRYGVTCRSGLVAAHFRRLFDLTCRRNRT